MNKNSYGKLSEKLINMNRRIATTVMGYYFDPLTREYYTLIKGKRIVLCMEWEFSPVSSVEDAATAIHKYCTQSGLSFDMRYSADSWEENPHAVVTIQDARICTEFYSSDDRLEVAISKALIESLSN